MNKISCNVCKDLLPVYIDKLCSEESEQLVENHLTGCEDCRNTYEAMTDKISVPKIEKEEKDKTDEFKLKLNKKWHRFLTTRAIAISSISIVGLAAIILGIYFLFFHYYYVSGDKIVFTEPCELSDGRVAIKISNAETKKGFNNVKFISYKDVKYGEKNTLYIVAENSLFDKSDEPNYVAHDLYNDENNERYDKIIYGLPEDANRKCLWIDDVTTLNYADGDIAKYFYENIDSFSKLCSDGDVWTCDGLDMEIVYHTGYESYDTTISNPIITAKIKDYYTKNNIFSIPDKKDKKQGDAEFIVYDNQINHQLELTHIVDGKVQYDSENNIYLNYVIKDNNKIIITSYDDMEYMVFSSIGNQKVSYPLNKTSKKSKLTDTAKMELINTFSSGIGDGSGFTSKDIKEFKYDKSDSKVILSYKAEISDINKLENFFKEFGLAADEFDKTKAEQLGIDKNSVVKSYITTDLCVLSDMYETKYSEYDIVKEGDKKYLYSYIENQKLDEKDVKAYYDEMEKYELEHE